MNDVHIRGRSPIIGTVLTDSNDAVYDRVEYKSNRLGWTVWSKVQNETVHEYAYDPSHRMIDTV